jgi:hypothetical protein
MRTQRVLREEKFSEEADKHMDDAKAIFGGGKKQKSQEVALDVFCFDVRFKRCCKDKEGRRCSGLAYPSLSLNSADTGMYADTTFSELARECKTLLIDWCVAWRKDMAALSLMF